VVALSPSPSPPHREDWVSVHSGSRKRQRRRRDGRGRCGHGRRGSQSPLVLKPETTRSGLIYKERARERGGGGGAQEQRKEKLMVGNGIWQHETKKKKRTLKNTKEKISELRPCHLTIVVWCGRWFKNSKT